MEENFICPHCGKSFCSRGSLGSHLGNHYKKDPSLRPKPMEPVSPSLHKRDESGKIVEYICKCGRSFTNKQSYCSHCSRCEIKQGHPIKNPKRGSNINDWWKKLKEEDPDKFHELHSKAGRASIKSLINKFGESPLSIFSKTPSEERDKAHKKQSETRKRKYLSGELTPADGIGNSFGSYFNGKYIRSSYEMIYVSYLFLNSFDYKYESVRVKYNNKSYISDFEIDGVLVEVKGNIGKIPEVKLAFENNGYNIRFICPNDIQLIKLYLRNLIDIDSLLVILKDSRKLKKQLYWSINKSNGDIKYKIINKGDNPDSYEYKILPFRNPLKP